MTSSHSVSNIKLPVVSIGVPVYNGARFLRQTLDSILAQSWTDFELVISDNASTDATGDICREYANRDRRIRYQRVDKLLPATNNFNRVLQAAIGRYFIWAAADDIWDGSYLEELVCVLEADPVYVGANGEISFIDENNCPVLNIVLNRTWEQDNHFTRLKGLSSFQPGTNIYIYSLYRTTELQAIGVRCYSRYPYKYRLGEFPTLFALAAKGKVKANPKARLYFRIHPSQVSHRHESVLMALFLEWRLLVAIFPWVRKGGGSWLLAGFAFIVAAAARTRLIIQFASQKIQRLFLSPEKKNAGS